MEIFKINENEQQENWKEFSKELLDIKRRGAKELVAYLDTTDFKTAPASTKFHLNIVGGLAQHSLNTLQMARQINTIAQLAILDENLVVAALLHDLCKVSYYIEGEEWDKEWKDKTNEWRKKKVWKTNDQLPLGHGEKSVIVAREYIDLTTEEMLAIRWHMLKWDVSDAAKYTMVAALDTTPLVKTIAIADQMAELYETNNQK